MAQALALLAGREREALHQNDPAALAELVCLETGCLNEFARARTEREAAAAAAGGADNPIFEQLMDQFDPATAIRLRQYHQGIQAHLEHARAISLGNRALARAAAASHAVWRQLLLDHASNP